MKGPKFVRLIIPRWLNYIMYLLGCFMIGSGLALEYKLPPGSRGGHGLEMLGWNRHEWGDLHFYVGLVLGGLVVAHLALHWSWLKNALKAIKGRVGWLALGLGFAVLALPLLLPVAG